MGNCLLTIKLYNNYPDGNCLTKLHSYCFYVLTLHKQPNSFLQTRFEFICNESDKKISEIFFQLKNECRLHDDAFGDGTNAIDVFCLIKHISQIK